MFPNLEYIISVFCEKANKITHEYWYKQIRKDWICKPAEEIIKQMPKKEQEKLKTKFGNIIPENQAEWKEEYDDQFLELMVEIFGFGYLVEKGFKPIFNNTPDLISTEACMECKSIRYSLDEQKYLKLVYAEPHEPVAKALRTDLHLFNESNPLYSKLLDTISRAKKQCEAQGRNKQYIYINMNFDTDAFVNKTKVVENLLNPLKKNDDNFEIIFIENFDPTLTLE